MQTKRETWNEAISIIHYLEEQTKLLKGVIEFAYDDDIKVIKVLSHYTLTCIIYV